MQRARILVGSLLALLPSSVAAQQQSAAQPSPAVVAATADSLIAAGNPRRAVAMLEQSLTSRRAPRVMYKLGASFARLGMRDSSLLWLDSASIYGLTTVAQYRDDPDLASLHGPAFDALLKRVEKRFSPCTDDADSRKFDFWVGDWDVRPTGGGPVVGQSSVQRVSGDCALLENWTAGNGSVGKSLNAYNTARQTWQQYWVGQGGGVTEYLESHWDGPTLVFVSSPTGTTPPASQYQRLSFTPLPTGEVRQHGEISSDGGKTWTTTYDFTYTRRR